MSGDLVDFLELPELMDLREPLGHQVLLVPRDPQAFRECPEREELVVSPDLRETEVTMARKDLRVLPERMVPEV